MHRSAALGSRTLVCAPFGRDGESISRVLTENGYDISVFSQIDEVAAALDERTGAVLLTEEALARGTSSLVDAVTKQPAWSDIPHILLASPTRGAGGGSAPFRNDLSVLITNTVILERPLSSVSLISSVAAAIRSRQKQFELRDSIAGLRQSEDRLRLATTAANIGIWDYDPTCDRLTWDLRTKELFGLGPDDEINLHAFLLRVHPTERQIVDNAVAEALNPSGSGGYSIEYRTINDNGEVLHWIAARGRAFFQDGKAIRFLGTVIDITESKSTVAALARSEAALRVESAALDEINQTLEQRVAERTEALETEISNRAVAEATLRQSQKMEAVGQLTGGIAHDFNNMLTGVIGAMDIMKRRIASKRFDDLDRFMDAATTSAQRAAKLTARLLAFSRQQSLDSKPLNVNELLVGLDDLLQRSVGENIELSVRIDQTIPTALADANQLENAILNLTINARDAMPGGGLLTLETSAVELDAAYVATHPEVKPGQYVVIAVSDTGVGMPASVIEKVFEPFFTTKPMGEGTGLGLSMVYGFARQSDGQVRIHSKPGIGTSVKIYLPAAEASEEPLDVQQIEIAEGQGQTVMLVEDDASVRLLVREVLEDLRYHVIEVADAYHAIPILESNKVISLMISDVGLPGMNGRQLAEIARRHRPQLPILFVTGYAENAAIRAGFLGNKMDMITKPFAVDQLSVKIAEMISS